MKTMTSQLRLPPSVMHFKTTVSPFIYGPTDDPETTSRPVSSMIFGCFGGTEIIKNIHW